MQYVIYCIDILVNQEYTAGAARARRHLGLDSCSAMDSDSMASFKEV
jgi:hypothetical protein